MDEADFAGRPSGIFDTVILQGIPKICSLHGGVEALDGRVERSDASVDLLHARVEKVDAHVDALDVRVEAVDAGVEALDVNVEALDARVG